MSSAPITSANIDPEIRALLPVLRHHLAALQGASPLSWRLAFSVAEERWGEGRGLALAHRSQVFLSALLASRCVPLQCVDPLDIDERHTLTEDEFILMRALSGMREDNAPLARDLISDLTGGRVTAATVKAGLTLVHLLSAPLTSIRRPTPPKLRAVS
ncbi:hypothetical protein L0666_10405 [Octadecabacter sp. CECT 8868]|uniref:hypothetical protein n=1 Tax=Octadecabacter algicola TaxID=2909342 RepID=UPI001F39A4B8|nr:hypothetical protein [Octadecabacter algicola]MCF2905403.1 hypothetical protein [Octadecabacter algicola]